MWLHGHNAAVILQGGVEALAAAPKERTLGSNLPYVAAMPDVGSHIRAYY